MVRFAGFVLFKWVLQAGTMWEANSPLLANSPIKSKGILGFGGERETRGITEMVYICFKQTETDASHFQQSIWLPSPASHKELDDPAQKLSQFIGGS